MNTELQNKLSQPFEDKDIEWRLQWTNDDKTSGRAVPYVTNRAIQARLDSVVGVGGWKNEYIPWHSDGKKQSQICGISIYFEDKKEWITKYDGAEDSDIEPIKGGLSDSMKRAAVQWGIGRYLYEMDAVYVNLDNSRKTPVIKDGEQTKLSAMHQKTIKKVFGESAGKPTSGTPAPKAVEKPDAQAQQPASTPPTQTPQASSQTGIYEIINAAQQPTVNGSNTHVQLRGANGKTVQAYIRGINPELVPGVRIYDTKVSKKEKDGIVFNTIDSYRIYDAAASEAA